MMENNENGVVQEVSTEVVVSDNTIVNSPANDDKVSKKNRNFNTLVVVLFILLALVLSYGSYKAGIKKANEINEKEVIKNNDENKDDEKETIKNNTENKDDKDNKEPEESKDNVNSGENENNNYSESDKDIIDDSGNQLDNNSSNNNENNVPVVDNNKEVIFVIDSESNSNIVLPKNEKYTFVKSYRSNVKFNNKDNEIITYYYLDSEVTCTAIPSTCDEDEEVYDVRIDLFVNGKLVIDSNYSYAFMAYEKSDAEKFVNTAPKYNGRLFYDSANSDEYLLLRYEDYVTHFGIDYEIIYYLIDSNGTLLDEFWSKISSGLFGVYGTKDMIGDRNYKKSDYKDDWYELYSDGLIDIHNNYIYEIRDIGGCFNADEYRHTVENGKLVSKKTATYDENYAAGAGQC